MNTDGIKRTYDGKVFETLKAIHEYAKANNHPDLCSYGIFYKKIKLGASVSQALTRASKKPSKINKALTMENIKKIAARENAKPENEFIEESLEDIFKLLRS